MVYRQKLEEAEMYLGSTNQDELLFQYLLAEVGVTGDTVIEVANAVLAQATAWRTISAQIEGIRLTTKKDIAEAVDGAGVQSSLARVVFIGETSA